MRKFYDIGQGNISYGEPPAGAGAGAGTLTGADNGLSIAADNVTAVLGQDTNQLGDPAKLLSNREIPLQFFQLELRGTGTPDQGVLSFTQDAQALWETVLADPGPGNAVQNLVYRVRPLVQTGGGTGAVDWIMSHSATNFFGVVDEVINFGWNIAPGGGPEVLGRPGIGFSLESYFSPSGNPLTSLLTESHQFYINPAGEQIRISSFTIDTLTDTINYELTVAILNLFTNPGPGQFVYASIIPGSLSLNLDATHQMSIEVTGFGAELAGAGFLLITGFTAIAFPSFSIPGAGNVRLTDVTPATGSFFPETDLNYNLGVASNRFNIAFIDQLSISGGSQFGANILPAGGWVVIAPNTAVEAQILLQSTGAVLLGAPAKGAIEFDGAQLYFTPAAAREVVLVGQNAGAAPAAGVGAAGANFFGTSGATYMGTPNDWATVSINGTTYKIPLYT